MGQDFRLHARCGCAHLQAAVSHEHGRASRPFAFASTTRKYERDRPFLVHYLELDLTLDPTRKRIEATATLDVRRVDADAGEIVLDAVGFDVRSVRLDGDVASFAYDGSSLRVAADRALAGARLTIDYAATPRKGLYFLEPDEHVPDRPRQVWSQCQEEDARHWVPCLDRPNVKMTTAMRVRVPRGWQTLSNGELVEERTASDAPVWEYYWRMEERHSSYLLTLVAGEFSVLRDEANGVPLTYLVPKGREEDGRRTFAKTPRMMAHFGELTGVAYPWKKYAQVVVSDFVFGGMENTTATTMYEHILLDARAALDITSDDLIAHELAHQWFGDLVTCRDWSEGWLNEGFATYMEHVWRGHLLGDDEYDYGLKHDLDAYLAEAHGRYRRPVVCQDYDAPLDLFDRHLYEKGGLVLHVLSREIGPAQFWAAVCAYLTRFARAVVETRDLQRALEDTSGRSLGRLFEQWLYKPGHAELEVTLEWDKRVLTVGTKQQQSTSDGVPGAFELTLELDIAEAGMPVRRERVRVTQRHESFSVACSTRPLYVVIDPRMRIVGDVQIKVAADMLHAQLAQAPTARGRWLAAQALGKLDDPVTIGALAARLDDDAEFWGVRAEAAAALGKIRSPESLEVLVRSAGVKQPKVRRAVVSALGSFKSLPAFEAIRPRTLSDESYLVEADAARALGKTRQSAAFDTLLEVLDKPSWADVLRAGAVDGLAALRDERATPHVLLRTRYGYPDRGRRAAILALAKLSSDRKTRELLEELLDDKDPHVRIDVARALHEMGDGKARPALRARLEVDLDPRVRRRLREVLRDLGSEGKHAVAQLREELEKAQNQHAELMARVGKLEARLEEAARAPVPSSPGGKPREASAPEPAHKGAPKAPGRAAKGKRR